MHEKTLPPKKLSVKPVRPNNGAQLSQFNSVPSEASNFEVKTSPLSGLHAHQVAAGGI
jgi:hypothetical protein